MTVVRSAGGAVLAGGRRCGPTRGRRGRGTSARPSTATPRARRSGPAGRRTRRCRWRGRCRARATRPCGGSRAPRAAPSRGRGSGCRRSAVESGSHATAAARVFGSSSGRSSPVATSITRRVLRSSPPSEVPTATSPPSRDGWNQSRAAVSSPWNRCGSSSRRGSAVRVAGRVAHEQGGLVESAAPLDGEQPVAGHPHAADHAHTEQLGQPRRAARRERASASSTARVRSFWALVHACTSGSVPSSSQRKGSGTSTPCSTSTTSSRRVAIAGGYAVPEPPFLRADLSPGTNPHAETGWVGPVRSAGGRTRLVGRARVLARRAAVAVDGPVTVPAGGVAVARRPAGRGARRAGPAAGRAPRRGVRRPTGHRGRRGRGAGAS